MLKVPVDISNYCDSGLLVICCIVCGILCLQSNIRATFNQVGIKA